MASPEKVGAFRHVLSEYLLQTSLHGYRYLAEPGLHWFERAVWLVVQVLATVGVAYHVQYMWDAYRSQVPVTTVESMHYHVSRVPFPAVAVCDVNKIARHRAREFANALITDYEIKEVSLDELAELVHYMGRLYDSSVVGMTSINRLNRLFSHYNITLDIPEVMKQLATTCDELLLMCKWEGRARSCSTLFETRKTMDGYCCTFNYIRSSDDFDLRFVIYLPTYTICPVWFVREAVFKLFYFPEAP